jgi:hypothetical protein
LTTNRNHYLTQAYYIPPVETEYARVSVERMVPAIQTIGGSTDRTSTNANDGLIKGQSQLYCYQPLLGYRLEKFPREPLRPGPVITAIGNTINLKHPACYLFPEENGCKPGDHFTIDELDDAVAFITYRPFPFFKSSWQELADTISLASLAATLGFLVFACARMLFRRRLPSRG